MGKYTADDNRSMQLNDNNDRYYSSRDIDRDDLFEDEEHKTTTTLEEGIMLLEFDNQIINTQKITEITSELVDLTLKTIVIKGSRRGYSLEYEEDTTRAIVYPTIRITIRTDFNKTLNMDFSPMIREDDGEETCQVRYENNAPSYSRYLPIHSSDNIQNPRAACFDKDESENPRSYGSDRLKKILSSEEDIRADINKSLNVYARFILKSMIVHQKSQMGGEG